jgi:tRNA 5-methylaminomethyl-2-thiouridine biosynthesis bifunctional protein
LKRPLRPAALVFDQSGTPRSIEFGDVYHPASGPGQARHVFLHGNDLPARWAGSRAFVIVELGFGLGLNLFATWDAWRSDPQRCARLHFVSIERHPFEVGDLATAHARYPEFLALSAHLRSAWPPLLPGCHRLHFDEGRVALTLVFADVVDALPGLRLGADAFYLDGFAPDRNREMWSVATMRALSKLARPGATVATWSVAAVVKEALNAAGFVVDRRPGFGAKREMLAGRFAPRWTVRRPPPPIPHWPERRVIVVGAGLAGAAIASRLSARGWRIDLVERHANAAAGASALRAGVFQPHVSRDDSVLSRLVRAGFLYSNRARPAALDDSSQWLARCGVLQLADGPENETRVAATAAMLALPRAYAEYVPRDTASAIAGASVPVGGWWFPEGGWLKPDALVRAQLAAVGETRVHLGREVAVIDRAGDLWRASDGERVIAQAPVVVIANAFEALHFVEIGASAFRLVRGQQTFLPAPPFRAPRVVVGGDGYILPAIDGTAVVGATYDLDSMDAETDAKSHSLNLERAEHMLPGSTVGVERVGLAGGVGFRCVATDRLPLAGAMIDIATARAQSTRLTGAQSRALPRIPGLYAAFAFASRGLAWTLLAAELLASELEGEPLPLEGDLVDAIDPGRFALQRLRRGRL